MTDRAQLLSEAYRRGLLPPAQAAAYEEANRRGIVQDKFVTGKSTAKGALGTLSAIASTVNEAVPGLDEAAAGVDAVRRTVRGEGNLGESWKAARDFQSGQQSGLREKRPVTSALSTGAGYVIQALPALLSGGATVAPQASTATNILSRAGAVGAKVARNATIGASYAAGNALAGRGDLQDRVSEADASIPMGAVVGAAVPAAIGAVRGASKVASAVTAPARRAAVRSANNLATKAGAGFLDPQSEAFKRLGEALRADKFTPEEIQAIQSDWLRVGGPPPAFMDLVAKGGRGQRTMALVRGAGVSGGGRNVASEYGNRVAVDLQDNAIARTRAMTPDQRPAEEVAADLRKSRSKLANEQYAGPYATPVEVTKDVADVLSDPPGRAALRQARADALERRDASQVAEIDALMSDQPPKQVSAATLDRVQIALRERGDRLAMGGNASRAAGTGARRTVVNQALDNVPALAEARSAYKGATRQIEGVEKVGPSVLSETPDAYTANVSRLGEEARGSVGVGAARTLEDAIGRPAEGATGVLNRIGTATNTGRNLATTFGEKPAADYRQSINQMRDQLNNARFINPNTGSQAAGRLADETLVENIPTGKTGLIMAVVRKIQNGATLTDAEREAIVKLATSTPDAISEGVRQQLIKANALPPPSAPKTVTNVLAIPAQDKRR